MQEQLLRIKRKRYYTTTWELGFISLSVHFSFYIDIRYFNILYTLIENNIFDWFTPIIQTNTKFLFLFFSSIFSINRMSWLLKNLNQHRYVYKHYKTIWGPNFCRWDDLKFPQAFSHMRRSSVYRRLNEIKGSRG